MSRVAVGGTFFPIHDGHHALLARAYQLSKGGILLIGITSDAMARKKYHKIDDYSKRAGNIIKFMLEEFDTRPTVVILEDPFSLTITEDFDYLIVSPETESIGSMINQQRIRLGRTPIKIERVAYVLAWDGKPISSTRILNNEIDIHGNPLSHR
jgi:pantetheine-phosphate adenylyltransferase